MKIKLDFISNSSSTSFVYISDGELGVDAFLTAAGVQRDSPVVDLFLQMHSELTHRIARGDKLGSESEIEEYIAAHAPMPNVVDRMRAAVHEGKKVVTGTFSSENNLAEMLLCVEIFEMDTDQFFLNAYDNYW